MLLLFLGRALLLDTGLSGRFWLPYWRFGSLLLGFLLCVYRIECDFQHLVPLPDLAWLDGLRQPFSDQLVRQNCVLLDLFNLLSRLKVRLSYPHVGIETWLMVLFALLPRLVSTSCLFKEA